MGVNYEYAKTQRSHPRDQIGDDVKLRPCVRCRLRDGCEIKAAKLRHLRGLGLSLVNFRCQAKLDSVKPGMVVNVKLKYVWNGDHTSGCSFEDGGPEDHPEAICEPGTLRGIVMRWARDGRVWVYFPEQDAGALWSYTQHCQVFMCSVFPDALTPTGETERVCKHCGLPEGAEAPGWNCRVVNGPLCDAPEYLECEYGSAEGM